MSVLGSSVIDAQARVEPLGRRSMVEDIATVTTGVPSSSSTTGRMTYSGELEGFRSVKVQSHLAPDVLIKVGLPTKRKDVRIQCTYDLLTSETRSIIGTCRHRSPAALASAGFAPQSCSSRCSQSKSYRKIVCLQRLSGGTGVILSAHC